MTAKELIEELQKCPDDTPVFLDNGEHAVNVDEVNFDYYYGFMRKVIIT